MQTIKIIYIEPLLKAIFLVLSVTAFSPLGLADEPPLPLISVEQARVLKEQDARAIFVDVRNSTAFEKNHIPTSINIPLHFIKTKAYLKEMNVILVSDGFSPEKLVLEQIRLSEQGFNTHIIAGGIAAWQQQGHSLTGHPQSNSLHLAPARNFLPGLHSTFFQLFIDSSEKPSAALTATSINVPTSSSEEISKLLEIIERSELSEREAVLIYNQDGDYTHLQKLPKYCRPTIFFLTGGMAAFRAVSDQAEAMLKSKESRTKKIGGCATCPSEEEMQNYSN